MIKGPGGKTTIPDRYNQIMNNLEKMKNDKAWRAYRLELLGPDSILGATLEWVELNLMTSLQMSPREWGCLLLVERARLIAHQRLQSMRSVIERHEANMIRARDSKNGNQNK